MQEKIAVFNVHNQLYGCSIHHIKEIVPTQPLTMLPNAPHAIEGITQIREGIVTILSLETLFGYENTLADEDLSFFVLLHPLALGLRVKEVIEIIEVNEDERQPLQEVASSSLEMFSYLVHKDNQLVYVLNTESFLDMPKLKEWLLTPNEEKGQIKTNE